MTKDEYAQKLRDPRWQKRRLEKLQEADWKCELCGDGSSELHVHHKKYTGDPWDAANSDLMVLCANHHGFLHAKQQMLVAVVNVTAENYFEARELLDELRGKNFVLHAAGLSTFDPDDAWNNIYARVMATKQEAQK